MEILIKDKNLLPNMVGIREATQLEEKIPELLDKAMSLIQTKGMAIKLYEGKMSYIAFSDGIQRDWKGRYPNGNPVTRWAPVTRGEFLQWVHTQSRPVKERVYHNLEDYINTDTPKERGEEEFPESRYLFGY